MHFAADEVEDGQKEHSQSRDVGGELSCPVPYRDNPHDGDGKLNDHVAHLTERMRFPLWFPPFQGPKSKNIPVP
jgi:hypothetical protein